MGSAMFDVELGWIPPDASVPKKGKNSFSHQKKRLNPTFP